MKLEPKYENWIVILAFLCLGFYFNANSLNALPKAIHPWAQSDKYALAIGFLNNGFDLSRPETYLMNREFPHNFKYASDNSITAVNFPLHEYLVALLMKLLDSKEIWIFRLYNLLLSFLGLFALYKIYRLLGLNIWLSLLGVSLLQFSPVFLLYQASTLGIINTLSLVLLGIYWYLIHIKREKTSYFFLSLAILTLASLIRTTALIPLIAMLIVESIRSIQIRKFYLAKFLACIVVALLFYWQYQYSLHMIYHYGSVFLYYLVPASSVEEFIRIAQKAKELWLFNYFSPIQYVFLLFLLMLVIWISFKHHDMIRKNKFYILLALACLSGYLLFSLAMFTKFEDHDYYLLDSLFIPILLFVPLGLLKIETLLQNYSKRSMFIALLILPISLIQAEQTVEEALIINAWNSTPEIIEAYEETALKFNKTSLNKNDKVLIIGAEMMPNLPLILLDRKGYVLRWPEEEMLKKALEWKKDYILFRKDHFFEKYHLAYPEFINHLEILDASSEVVIARPSKIKAEKKVSDFYPKENLELLFAESFELENSSNNWLNISLKDSLAYVSRKSEYGLTFAKQIKFNESQPLLILCKGQVSLNTKCKWVIEFNHENESVTNYYRSQDLKKSDSGEHNRLEFYSRDRVYAHHGITELKLYFWNPDAQEFYINNLQIEVYKSD